MCCGVKGLMGHILWITLFVLSIPATAHAGMDPGVLGSLYQIAYTRVFGVLAGWMLKALPGTSHPYLKG